MRNISLVDCGRMRTATYMARTKNKPKAPKKIMYASS